jgi:hypothetical protein
VLFFSVYTYCGNFNLTIIAIHNYCEQIPVIHSMLEDLFCNGRFYGSVVNTLDLYAWSSGFDSFWFLVQRLTDVTANFKNNTSWQYVILCIESRLNMLTTCQTSCFLYFIIYNMFGCFTAILSHLFWFYNEWHMY